MDGERDERVGRADTRVGANDDTLAAPRNAVVLLLDSLNRHMVGGTAARSSTRRTWTASHVSGRCASRRT